jgi:hypothetical protein
MKLSQKKNSIWRGRNALQGKSKILFTLAALGVLGGFFVALAETLTIPAITVHTSADEKVWAGNNTVTWDKCVTGNQVNISLAKGGDFYKNIMMGVSCSENNAYIWNTAAKIGTPESLVYEDGDYKVMVYNTATGEYGYSKTITLDNTAPVFANDAISAPTAGIPVGGKTATVSWNTAITETHLATKPISLAYTYADDGGSHTFPMKDVNGVDATGIANSGIFVWKLPSNVLWSDVTINISAVDTVGNVGNQESKAFNIDTVAPVVVVTSLNGGERLKGGATPEVTWTVDGVAGVTNSSTVFQFTSDGTIWNDIVLWMVSGLYRIR